MQYKKTSIRLSENDYEFLKSYPINLSKLIRLAISDLKLKMEAERGTAAKQNSRPDTHSAETEGGLECT
jgi:hypothetical protein